MKSVQDSALRSILAAIAFLIVSSVFGADETTPLPKPLVKVGDRWTFRHMDYWTNATQSTYEHRVTGVEADVIVGVRTASGKQGESDVFWTSELNYVVSGSGLIMTPNWGILKFPLKVGASHENTFETARRNSPIRARHTMTMKVIGWEEITVPAGKFRALKIEGNGTFIGLNDRYSGWTKLGVWYVPEVRHWVKITYEDGTSRPNAKDGHELVEFSVQ